MTSDEILAGIDRSLQAIRTERERLKDARAKLIGEVGAPTSQPVRRRPRRRRTTLQLVLAALDPAEPRTAADIEKISKVARARAGTTLSRLVKDGKAVKAERGYLRASA